MQPAEAPGFDERAARVGLDRLRRFGGDALAREMGEIFAELMPERLAAARAGLDRGDREAVARAAHALRGSCAQMGVAAAERLCRDLEAGAGAGDPASLRRTVELIEGDCAAYQAWLDGALRAAPEGT
jgi:HPt (histidine-containing phosphotransfer) domain-containing protein